MKGLVVNALACILGSTVGSDLVEQYVTQSTAISSTLAEKKSDKAIWMAID